jgi:dTDP-4-dehydrorhamnose reductase
MRVLLTGSTGRLGGAFSSLWGRHSEVELISPSRQELDLSEPDQVRSFLSRVEFDWLVNAAAITNLEQCLDHPDLARRVNVDTPKIMAEACGERSSRLVHFSTDYVLSGERPGMKTELDATGAVNEYGASKCAGELAVLEANADALVARVSWLFGPSSEQRPSHFDNVLHRALAGEKQHLICDKFSVPTFTYDVVHWVHALLKADSCGIYHLCNLGEPESWYSYAQKVCRLAVDLGYELDEDNLLPVNLVDIDFFRERRPIHTAMKPARMIEEGIMTPRHWRDAAIDYLKIR